MVLAGWAALTVLGAPGGTLAGGGETVLYLEQRIDFSSASGMQQTNSHRLWYDGRRLRAEVEGGKHQSVLLLELPGDDVKLLFPTLRAWARFSREEYVRALAARFGHLLDGEWTLEEGEGEESLGPFRCRKFVLRLASPRPLQSELCLADVEGVAPGLYAELMQRLGLDAIFGRLYEKVAALGRIPVLVRSRLTGPGEETRVEQRLVRTERRPAEPGLFSVPADFQEITDLALAPEAQGGTK